MEKEDIVSQEEYPPARIYPDVYPRFEYEPTTDKFEVVTAGSCGEGVVSKAHFVPGDIVFRFTGPVLNDRTLFTLELTPTAHVHDPYVMGKVLHSCDPNTFCDMATRTFTAVKEINPGDYLTMDYETTESELFRFFECQCGAPNCRGLIMGSKYRKPIEMTEEEETVAAASR